MTFYALRSYRDNGQHYEGQLGDEATPAEFLRNLWAVMDECHRVLKESGSAFIELGEKYAGTGGGNGQSGLVGIKPFLEPGKADNRAHPRNNTKQTSGWARPKSLMGLPWAFALGLINPALFRAHIDPGEHPQWILRSEIIWHRLNGLPESVTDRVRRSHSAIFHLVKSRWYYSSVDEIREGTRDWGDRSQRNGTRFDETPGRSFTINSPPNPLGSLPGSVWSMPSEPLVIPKWAEERYNLPQHFASFPSELPRRLILGFSPPGICMVCGEGRRPVLEKRYEHRQNRLGNRFADGLAAEGVHGNGRPGSSAAPDVKLEATILGYACACATPNAPTTPARVLDPFGGTGTTAGVARALGRVAISLDLSADYSRLAKWRIESSGHFKKAEQKTWSERQGTIL